MTNEQKWQIQWLIQEQLDGIYTRIMDEHKLEPSTNENEAFIDRCIRHWMKEGDTQFEDFMGEE